MPNPLQNRPVVITIAGFDPSGGAGILADIKTFEALGVYGLAAATSNTFQIDSEFFGVDWIEQKKLHYQIGTLFAKYCPTHVKIGLIKDFKSMERVVRLLKKLNPAVQIVWDPIIKSSSGFCFHKEQQIIQTKILGQLSLITPNWTEAMTLWAGGLPQIMDMSEHCPVLIKGGHRPDHYGSDLLLDKRVSTELPGNHFGGRSKHGTGCVLSAAIIAHLARGNYLEDACRKAKNYTEQFILSNNLNLGYHYRNEQAN
ncbi:MAG TPA: hydroxymethylpyrimidine/phosphomethylpyrimidine kinase [Bacteroidales bacterium]|nr:hydroxymethylpyrimidine/phosphomethylpyrimidine kinase [Bacteroidales bacterium]